MFDNIDFKQHFNLLVVAPTNRGKSYLIQKEIWPRLKPKFDVLVICSPTLSLSGDYRDPIFEEDNKTVFKIEKDILGALQEIIDSQKEMFNMWKMDIIEKEEIPNICIIMDDCITDKSIFNFRGVLDSFSTKNRHYNMSFIVTSQRLSAIPRTLRLNAKYTILFSTYNMSETEQFMHQYCMKKHRKQLSEKIVEVFKTPYNFIFCNNDTHDISKRLLINGDQHISFD